MLDGHDVTTFHGAIDALRKDYPNLSVQDGRRFIDNGHIVTTAGISAGIDGSLNVVARLLGRRVADQVATYMEYHWTPESYLATKYSYLNPSTSDNGRRLQSAEIEVEAKNLDGAERIYRAVLAGDPHNRDAWTRLALALHKNDDHAGAAEAFARAADEDPTAAAAMAGMARPAARSYYNAASEYALADRPEDAVLMLRKAFDAGFTDRNAVAKDPSFAKLKDE